MTNTARRQQATNAMLRAHVGRYPGAVLVDWAPASRGRPWFGRDRIHLNAAGRKAFAPVGYPAATWSVTAFEPRVALPGGPVVASQPAVPEGLRAERTGDYQVRLAWNEARASHDRLALEGIGQAGALERVHQS